MRQPYAPWARLAILTGPRKTELFTLQWTNVDLEQGFITLPQTKSGKVQYAPMNEEAKALFRDFPFWKYSAWVFPNKTTGSHLDSYNFYGRIFRPAVEPAKLEGLRWHTLRHSFASRLAMNGQSDSTIDALLRHSVTALVQRYAHLSPTHLRAAVEGVANYGRPVTGGLKVAPEDQANDGMGLVGISSPIATKATSEEAKNS
ncbi:MAG: site-specific integrase [Nitrospirales bacterium]